MGKSTINGPFSIAMLNYQRVSSKVVCPKFWNRNMFQPFLGRIFGSGSGGVVPVVPSATGGVQTGPLWKLRCHCEGPQTAGAPSSGTDRWLGPRGRDLLRIPELAIWPYGSWVFVGHHWRWQPRWNLYWKYAKHGYIWLIFSIKWAVAEWLLNPCWLMTSKIQTFGFYYSFLFDYWVTIFTGGILRIRKW